MRNGRTPASGGGSLRGCNTLELRAKLGPDNTRRSPAPKDTSMAGMVCDAWEGEEEEAVLSLLLEGDGWGMAEAAEHAS